MKRNIKITTLWLLTISGFASHCLADFLPIFWGKNLAVMAQDGIADQGMIALMMTLAFLIPTLGILCAISTAKFLHIVNAVLAVLIALFNVAHAVMELPSDNAGQYIVLPLMIIIGLVLAYHSVKNVKEVRDYEEL